MALPQIMEGIWTEKVGGTEVLQYKTDLPVLRPSDGEILVRNDFCGVNYIDMCVASALSFFPLRSLSTHLPRFKFPFTDSTLTISAPVFTLHRSPKSLAAKSVEPSLAPTAMSTVFKPATVVACLGARGYAQSTVVSAKYACKIPDGLSSEVACAALLQGLTALTLVKESYETKNGDWILVHAAAGGVGLWLCQLLKAVGAKVIGTASSDKKRALALEHGAAYALDSNADLVAEVKEITGGQMVAAVYDGVGKATFDTDLEVAGPKGSVVCFGNASGPVEPLALDCLTPKSIKLLRPMLFTYIATRDEFEHYATELFDFILKEEPNVQIHRIYALQDAATAQEDLEGRRTTGKCLLKP